MGALLVAFAVLATSPVAAQDGDCSYTVGKHGSAELSPDCERQLAATTSDEQRADLLFRLAWSMNDNDAPLGAMALLRRAVALDPGDAGYWTELGYTEGELGMLREAMISLDQALAIDPTHAEALNERGWARQTLGDFEGANADYARYFELHGDHPGARLSLARNLVWLGRLDEAQKELERLAGAGEFPDGVAEQRELIDRIRRYRPAGDQAALCQLDSSISQRARAELLFDACTRAFLDSNDPEKRADFLTVRATARNVIEGALGAGYDDLRIAAGIDPETARRYVNTGYALLQIRHSWAARNEFDRALELGLPTDLMTAVALAGRAQANFALDERDAAVADARRSIEIEPNQAATRLLGEIAFADGDKDFAREMWLTTYRMGSREDGLIADLKSVGVDDPENWPEDDRS